MLAQYAIAMTCISIHVDEIFNNEKSFKGKLTLRDTMIALDIIHRCISGVMNTCLTIDLINAFWSLFR